MPQSSKYVPLPADRSDRNGRRLVARAVVIDEFAVQAAADRGRDVATRYRDGNLLRLNRAGRARIAGASGRAGAGLDDGAHERLQLCRGNTLRPDLIPDSSGTDQSR